MNSVNLCEFTWSFNDSYRKISSIKVIAQDVEEARCEIIKILSIIKDNIDNYNSVDFWNY